MPSRPGSRQGHVGLPPLSTPLKLLGLLRSDAASRARAQDPALESEEWLLAWWIAAGRREYPGMADPLKAEHYQWLQAASESAPAATAFPLTRALLLLRSVRTDTHALGDVSTAAGQEAFVDWVLHHGLAEHALWDFLSPAQQALLRDPGRLLAAGLFPLNSLQILFLRLNEPEFCDRLETTRPSAASLALVEADLSRRDIMPGVIDQLRRPPAAKPRPAPLSARPQRAGVNLIGFAKGEMGVGEDVRMAALSCQSAGIPFSIFNVPLGDTHRSADGRFSHRVEADLPHDVNIFCLTAFDTFDFFARHGAAAFRNRYNIGYWPWELPRFPAAWAPVTELVDEIWASTEFTARAFAMSGARNVRHMPMAVAVDAAAVRAAPRRQLPVPRTAYVFLFVFDWNSYPSRKNPQASVEAFIGAFGHDRTADVCLVLKTMGAREDDPRWAAFQRLVEKDPRIVVVNETMDRAAVLRLIADCDCFVSLHRAEGFGRGLAEAMLLGKPVIATAFSGNLDFCTPTTAFLVPAGEAVVGPEDYPFAEGQVWAEPSFFAAVDAFRSAFSDRALGQRRAQAGQHTVQKLYSPEAVGQRYASRLRQIAASR